MMILVAPLAVALTCFIIYVIERKSKSEPISWEHVVKLCLFGGLLSAGVVFASSSEAVIEAVKNVELPSVQDMFVGVPTF